MSSVRDSSHGSSDEPRAHFRLPEECLAWKGSPRGLGFALACISPEMLCQ